MKDVKTDGSDRPARDINIVLKEHTDELMAIPGVVGLFARENEEKINCIHIQVVKKTTEIENNVPRSIEGYPVLIEETGEIEPLK